MPAGNFARDKLVNRDNLEALLFVGLLLSGLSLFPCLKKRNCRKAVPPLNFYTTHASYFSLLVNTYFIRLSKCLPILIIALFLSILLQ